MNIKTKYRIKEVTEGTNIRYYVQYKKFLFWHYIVDCYDEPFEYDSLEDAKHDIEILKIEPVIRYIDVD